MVAIYLLTDLIVIECWIKIAACLYNIPILYDKYRQHIIAFKRQNSLMSMLTYDAGIECRGTLGAESDS